MQGATKNHQLLVSMLMTFPGKMTNPYIVNMCRVMQTVKVRKWPSALTTFLWCLILEKVLPQFLDS